MWPPFRREPSSLALVANLLVLGGVACDPAIGEPSNSRVGSPAAPSSPSFPTPPARSPHALEPSKLIFSQDIGEGPECGFYFRQLRQLYDSARSCTDSSACLLLGDEHHGYAQDLGYAAVNSEKAQAAIRAMISNRPACAYETAPRSKPSNYRAICTHGRCEACYGSACEKGDSPSEPTWMEMDRRAEEGLPHGVDDVVRINEAKDSLRRISSRAVHYYSIYGKFPASAPLTPEAACCPSLAQGCAGGDWSHRTWQALAFSIEHRRWLQYRFRVESKGEGRTATFGAEAVQDLDCDGKVGTWRVTGRIGEDGKPVVTEPAIPDEDIGE